MKPPAAPEPPLACGNCGRPLQRLKLDGHYRQPVEIDLCAPCHLVWFDPLESVRLSGASMLELLGAMASAQAEPHHPLGDRAACPRCGGGLKRVHNRSRWGTTLLLECRRGHGAWQSFAMFLAEKGLVRPLSPADRARLARDDGAIACLNCGAPLAGDGAGAACRYCGSVPGLIDIARVAHALDPEGATAGDPAHATPARRHVFGCHACGAALPEGPALQCGHCGATLASPDLRRAYALLQPLGPALREHQRRPAPHVREKRLQALRADLDRRREWVQEMEASAGHAREPEGPDEWWQAMLRGQPDFRAAVPGWVRLLFWALVALLLYWWAGGFGR